MYGLFLAEIFSQHTISEISEQKFFTQNSENNTCRHCGDFVLQKSGISDMWNFKRARVWTFFFSSVYEYVFDALFREPRYGSLFTCMLTSALTMTTTKKEHWNNGLFAGNVLYMRCVMLPPPPCWEEWRILYFGAFKLI